MVGTSENSWKQVENDTCSRLRDCYLAFESLSKTFPIVERKSVDLLDSILNQLDQSQSIAESDLFENALNELPDFKVKLMTKINLHVSFLLNSVKNDLEMVNDKLRNVEDLYRKAGEHFQSHKELFSLSELERSSERRLSFNELFGNLDRILLVLRKDLDKKLRLSEEVRMDSNKVEMLRTALKTQKQVTDQIQWTLFVGSSVGVLAELKESN